MKQLNRDLVINYITVKQSKYKERRDAAIVDGHLSESNDYEIRILPLTNLLNHIMQGKFDILCRHNSNKTPKKTQENK